MIFGRVNGPWTLKFGQIFSYLTIFFHYAWRYWFGLQVYNDELQIKFAFRSGPMIFGRVMALELWNVAKYLVVTAFFRYACIWLIFGMTVYNHKLQISFEIRSGWMIFSQLAAVGLWNLAKYLVVTTLFHYDLRYWLDFWYVNLRRLEDTDLKQ
jgi:hypothetical protein